MVGDESGLCKELSWLSGETRRTRIIKKAKQSRSLAVTALCWSGHSGYVGLDMQPVGCRSDGCPGCAAPSSPNG